MLHDCGNLKLEGRVIADAVWDGACEDMAVTVLVLQSFAVQRGPACGAAQHKATGSAVACRPGQIADPLEAKHRVVDEEGDHRHAVVGVRRRRRNPVGHRTGFVDAFLQNLTVDGLFIVHHLIGIFGRIVLTQRVVDPDRAEQAFHPKGAAFIRHNRHHVIADLLVTQQRGQDADKGHCGGNFTLARTFELCIKLGQRRDFQFVGFGFPFRELATQSFPAVRQIGFLRVVQFHERCFWQVFIAHRDLKAIAERAQLILGHFLLLVGRVLTFTRRAHTVTLNRFDQEAGWSAFGFCRAFEGSINFLRIMSATTQSKDLLVAPVLDQLRGLWVFAKEMFADISAVFGFEGLVVTVDCFIHQLTQFARGVFFQELVPALAPKQFDDVPACAAEVTLKFLNDLVVAAYRAIQTLQVAVHNKD